MAGDQHPLDSSKQLTERLDITFALQSAGLGLWEVDPITNQVIWDEQCRQLFGLAKRNELPYEQAIQYIHPQDVTRVDQAVAWALNPRSGGLYNQTYRTIGADDNQLRWVCFQGRADFSPTGQLYRFAGIAQEVTPQKLAQQQLEELTHQLMGKIEELQQSEDRYRRLAISLEEQVQQRTQTLEAVNEELLRSGEEQARSRQQAEESEARFRALIQEAPVATSLFVGRDLRVELANQPMLSMWGKGPSQLGKTFANILPEIADQPFLSILDTVYTTGQAYSAKEDRADLVVNGVLGTYYFDFTYKPILNAKGEVREILQMATDVTQQVVARQALEQKEAALSNAIELAELGTFSVDIATNILTVSPRVADWFGFDSPMDDATAFIAGVGEPDQDHVRTSLYNALLPGSDGRYDVTHSVIHAKTGRRIVIHALGRVYFDAAGQPHRLEGTAQDVTAQQELQLVLAQQVQQRTQELAAAGEKLATTNKELATHNEEYAAINEALTATNQALAITNQDLIRSNQNLEQFAYIASHDLQEPLRKIQQFSDLLQSQYSGVLGEGTTYLKRMQVAAERMSALIKDLLTFSRIATTQAVAQPVLLHEVVSQALESLSVVIEESRAQIDVDELPTVQGDSRQLNQLFQNLLSNALKFRRTDPNGSLVTPQIWVRARLVSKNELAASVKPARSSETYHLIEVIDNGIGFHEKYADRIFQVFQRLHGKHEFAGTGVGLAIVQKVVTNHGGAITASSQPNQGATFKLYLPA